MKPTAVAHRAFRPVKGAVRPTLADAAKLLRGLDHPEFMPHGRPRDKESKRIPL